MNIGKFGVRAVTDKMTSAEAAGFTRRAEQRGYEAVWIAEAFGRDPMTHAAWLLSQSSTIAVGTSIANIYARDPMASRAAQYTLNDHWNGRFLLGVGVSHAPIVESTRGHRYDKPVQAMAGYLNAMKNLPEYLAAPPPRKPQTLVAALGPKMLETAAVHGDGALPLLTTPQHTADARRILGPGKLLCPEQFVLLESNAAKARELGRGAIGWILKAANYHNSAKRQGFSDAEIEGLQDRLVDALVAWGTIEQIRARLREHFDAGADHVVINEIPNPAAASPEQVLQLLAPAGTT
jgi:probable F420-dependent oxidoreductase